MKPQIEAEALDGRDASPHLGEFVWTRDANLFGWTALLGGAPGGPDVSPYAAPARMADLSRLPPTFLACGALDLFLEENLDYARRLIRAGVATELDAKRALEKACRLAAVLCRLLFAFEALHRITPRSLRTCRVRPRRPSCLRSLRWTES